jgi:hypothetical protein
MAQPWIERADRGEHTRGAIAILKAGFIPCTCISALATDIPKHDLEAAEPTAR